MKAYSYIRFSNPEQLKGDSYRRQLEASKKYCSEHGFELDESLTFNDLGISAYSGANRTKGALSEFLKFVEAGRIEGGSVLLVESLDRLSREQTFDALSLFSTIIKSGIKLVTLQDGMIYDRQTIDEDWTKLIFSIVSLARAFDESHVKSLRLQAAWQNKRKQAKEGILLTKVKPAWLEVVNCKFIPIPEAVNVIRQIFEMKLQGFGVRYIEQYLNKQKGIWQPPYNPKRKSPGWRNSYIRKLLTNKALIGEFTPCRKVNGRRIACEPIENYYPQVIDPELFNNVQSVIERNLMINGYAGGRTGVCRNLFSGIVRCGLCKSPMHYTDKGDECTYLVCDGAKRLHICQAKPIPYRETEEIVLSNLVDAGKNIFSLFEGSNSQISNLQFLLTSNQQTLSELNRQVHNLTDSISLTDSPAVRQALQDKLKQVLSDIDAIQKQVNDLQIQINKLSSEPAKLKQSIDNLNKFYTAMEETSEQDKVNLRLQLRQQIRRIVKEICIYPLTEPYVPVQEIEPSIYLTMQSKHIDRITVKFNTGSDIKFSIIALKTFAVKE